MLAPLAAATAIKKYGTAIDSAAVPFVSNSTGPSCGIGYTYCGYILKEQKRIFAGPPVPSSTHRR